MSDIIFRRNYERVIGIEGVWSDNPDDSGGQTWKGIARKRWPLWEGWARVDAARQLLGFPGGLTLDTELERMVREFYRAHFWGVLHGDAVSGLSTRIAGELFEQGVNLGTARTARHLQMALNALNDGGRYYADVDEDGMVGPDTVSKLAAYLERRGAEGETVLLRMLNTLQGAHCIELSRRREKDEAFTYGWFLHRVTIV